MVGGGGGIGTGTVTVLFTDLVSSTQIMDLLGGSKFEKLRQSHLGLLGQTIAAHGGVEVKTLGDGVMAVFTAASDAVAAAVAMQQAVERRGRRAPTHLSMRVGVALGDATEYAGDWFGTPVVEAARLCAQSGGGQILVTDTVRAVTEARSNVRFVPMGTLSLRGLAAEMAVWRLDWAELAAPATVALPGPLQTTEAFGFVGRRAELVTLRAAFERAATGGRHVVLIGGEPGVGKSRLAAEFAREVHAEGASVLFGRCDEGPAMAYQPFVEALSHYLRHARPAELPNGLGQMAGDLAHLVPELAAVAAGLPSPLRSDPENEQHHLFETISSWLGAASADEPLVVVLDDLHWATQPTLLLLRHVVRATSPARLLVMGIYRDTEFGAAHSLANLLADLRRDPGVERLVVGGLDEAEVMALLETPGHSLGENARGVARAIRAHTEGNPFLVGELVRHMVEAGAFGGEGDGSLENLGIPEGVLRRRGRFSEEPRLERIANDPGLETVTRAFAMAGYSLEPSDDPGVLIFDGGLVVVTYVVDMLGVVGMHLRSGGIAYVVHAERLSKGVEQQLDRLRVDGKLVVPLAFRALDAAMSDGNVDTLLADLRNYSARDNLFDTKNSLVDDRHFFGRDAALTTMGFLTHRDEHILLTGLRKVGKTSLLNIFRQHLLEYPVCKIDLQFYDRNAEDWHLAIFAQVLRAFDTWARPRRNAWTFEQESPTTTTAFRDALDIRLDKLGSGRDLRVALLLDEVERVFPVPGEEGATRRWLLAAQSLRALAQESQRRLVIVAADLRPIANRVNLMSRRQTNPFFQFFHEMPIPLFDLDATREMLTVIGTAMNIDVDAEFAYALHHLTGGHPSLARSIAAEASRRRSSLRQLTPRDLDLAVMAMLENGAIDTFLQNNIWDPMTTVEKEVVTAVVYGENVVKPTRTAGSDRNFEWRQAVVNLRQQGLLDRNFLTMDILAQRIREREVGVFL